MACFFPSTCPPPYFAPILHAVILCVCVCVCGALKSSSSGCFHLRLLPDVQQNDGKKLFLFPPSSFQGSVLTASLIEQFSDVCVSSSDPLAKLMLCWTFHLFGRRQKLKRKKVLSGGGAKTYGEDMGIRGLKNMEPLRNYFSSRQDI